MLPIPNILTNSSSSNNNNRDHHTASSNLMVDSPVSALAGHQGIRAAALQDHQHHHLMATPDILRCRTDHRHLDITAHLATVCHLLKAHSLHLSKCLSGHPAHINRAARYLRSKRQQDHLRFTQTRCHKKRKHQTLFRSQLPSKSPRQVMVVRRRQQRARPVLRSSPSRTLQQR